MREIEFRAWSNEHHMYCDFVTLDELGRWIGWMKTSMVLLNTRDIVLEQCTGLHDKNGEKLYEGNIVSGYNGDYIGVIKQHPSGEWQIVWTSGQDKVDSLYSHQKICEVISDIHRTPELLKIKK